MRTGTSVRRRAMYTTEIFKHGRSVLSAFGGGNSPARILAHAPDHQIPAAPRTLALAATPLHLAAAVDSRPRTHVLGRSDHRALSRWRGGQAASLRLLRSGVDAHLPPI